MRINPNTMVTVWFFLTYWSAYISPLRLNMPLISSHMTNSVRGLYAISPLSPLPGLRTKTAPCFIKARVTDFWICWDSVKHVRRGGFISFVWKISFIMYNCFFGLPWRHKTIKQRSYYREVFTFQYPPPTIIKVICAIGQWWIVQHPTFLVLQFTYFFPSARRAHTG